MKIDELEITTINNTKYVKKADADKLFKEALKNKISIKSLLSNPCDTIALASTKINEEYKLVDIDIELLKKAIVILEQVEASRITIGFKEDNPVLLGEYDKETNRMKGVVIAPMVG